MRAITPFCISCRTSERLVVGDPRAVVEAHIAIIAFSAVIVKMRLAKTTSPAFMSAARWCRLFCLTVRLRLDIVAHSHALRVLGRPPTRARPPREVGKIPFFVDVRFSCRQEGSQRTLVARELLRHEKRQICYLRNATGFQTTTLLGQYFMHCHAPPCTTMHHHTAL